MLKNFSDKLYNEKMEKFLKDIEFESFNYFIGVPYPMFAYLSDESKREITVVEPETVETLKLCIMKLKNFYVAEIEYDNFKNKLKKYFKHFNLDIDKLEDCMITFETKQKQAQNLKNSIAVAK